MTQEDYAALEAEVEQLESVERMRIAEQIKTAREFGDLKENAEYHAAKEAAAHLESKITRLRHRLAGAQIVEKAGGDEVGFGSTVELEDETSGKALRYTLVSHARAAPAQGLLSVESPVAVALLGRRAGEVAVVATPGGERRMKVVAVD